MKAPLTFVLLYITVFSWKPVLAQGDANGVNVVQPTIMVIPHVKDGEDLRTVLDGDFNKREVVAKIKNGFDNRGFTTKDFAATLNAAKDDKIFNTNTQTDIKSDLVGYSGADIYVDVEYHVVTTSPRGKIAKIILSGYDVATGDALSSIICDSREKYDTEDGLLVNVAIMMPPAAVGDDPSKRSQVPCLEDFLNILQSKFSQMVKNGRSVKVNFTVASDAARNFESRIKTANDKLLKSIIDDWLGDNAKGNYAHFQGGGPTHLFYDVVKIPLFDKNGRNLGLNKFGDYITDFLSSKGVKATSSVKHGGLFITINN